MKRFAELQVEGAVKTGWYTNLSASVAIHSAKPLQWTYPPEVAETDGRYAVTKKCH